MIRPPPADDSPHRNPEACRALLDAGADPNARIGPLDISPREAAHAIDSPTMIGILEQPGRKPGRVGP